MSSYLVIQLYCTPVEAGATNSALAGKVARLPEFDAARIELEQKAEADYEMHLHWAAQHPGQDPADRAYYLLRVESPTDIPEHVLRDVETEITDWIDSTYNDASDEIIEVQWGSYAGTRLLN
ncbi:hypothetical protein FEK35_09335 [Nocardia cyriacigeorgica]|uniref:Uncharacterized protein n=1 Tax=Nocardia cyriacigeorgica TaxID=135487 RepID=A0A5R8PGD7_9NOCA|nr:hypothetical protein [Nocardia cyriacigeorgica]TLG13966.1 hypothetical protein FEK35_09335 [Nocardia cyriacigeorgica]